MRSIRLEDAAVAVRPEGTIGGTSVYGTLKFAFFKPSVAGEKIT